MGLRDTYIPVVLEVVYGLRTITSYFKRTVYYSADPKDETFALALLH